jgi:acyl-[acyl-carrier-protein]-phospholipid O-acyltransferase/long-chain-fatty-acid--[acyl-carrier-protein] ligase
MIFRFIFNYIFKVEVEGIENFKNASGNALIIANHNSFLDAFFLWSYISEDLHFAIHPLIAKKWYVKPFLHLAKFYHVDPTQPMAVKSIIDEVKKGNRVVIFPEGRITTTGRLMKIYPGSAIIADKCDAQIIPVCIEGNQYLLFSHFGSTLKARPKSKIKINILPATRLAINENLKGEERRKEAMRNLYDLMTNMRYNSAKWDQTLFDSFVDAKNLVGRGKIILEDMSRKTVNYGKLLTVAFILGKLIAKQNRKDDYVGFMLPNSIAGTAVFFGMQAFGLTPAMLNFSTGIKNMISCCKTALIKNVYTSREFIEKGSLHDVVNAMKAEGVNIIYLEDLAKTIKLKDKLTGLFASFFPGWYYKKSSGKKHDPKKPAVILFTSGSEGVPKGVVLSHENFMANIFQIRSILDFGITDSFFNAMPVFHSFGLTGGMLLPLLSGIKTFMYPSPLHYRVIPELIYDSNATIMFGTDTFLNGYAKSAHPYDFYSIRIAVVGAEKLKEATARNFFNTFGVRIWEGYGVTETSPVIAVNTNMYYKYGTVGRPLVGIETRLEEVPGVKEGKRLFIKGKNVMIGYMKIDNPGVIQPLEDGWHDTGDIVTIDDEGYIAIKGRAKRFAKIAGEMVSLAAVETAILKLWPDFEHAVVAVPDPKKGEQLVLYTTRPNTVFNEIGAEFKKQGLSELFIPKKIKVIEQMYLMGNGKTDYVTIGELAKEEFK